MKWTRAEQAVDADFLQKVDGLDGRADPQAYFSNLRSVGRADLAVEFLARALPRLEAVVWAADVVSQLDAARSRDDEAAMRAVRLWISDPGSEARRRAAMDAAQACEPSAPAWMTAMAAFYSGGSVAPADCEPLHPPLDAAGRFTAGAILIACADTDNMDAALDHCLARGERLAAEGLGARSSG